CEFENPYGVVVSVGGQTPNNRVKSLSNYGFPILGTSAENIDRAEDRYKFSYLLDTLGIRQPEWASFTSLQEVQIFAEQVGYPLLVRPSYVLSGSAMKVCYDQEQLEQYTREASEVSPAYPVTISKFFQKVKEIELDAVAQHGEVKVCVISEHIENAGVHSGDATIVLPPQTVNEETQARIEEVGRAIARALNITGPFNIQFLAKNNQVYVIEANLRASRTFPFISKVTGVNLIALFVDALFTENLAPVSLPVLHFTAVKAPQFSFSRLTGADPVLNVEMASTGEVACFGEDLEEAYLKAIIATGGHVPQQGIFISLGGEDKKQRFLESARLLATLGLPLYATEKTYQFLLDHGIVSTMLYKLHEQKEPNILTYFRDHQVDLAINVADSYISSEVDKDGYAIRRYAIDHNIPLFTKIKQARLFARAIIEKDLETIPIKSWNEY
ncbi:MAG TPA: ATP-grasp domain-containing protein, partial [Ktedonobacteraceae bacterium]|nr:ATP-grasp domain-containing protein [Ktedonobacteraceae bacterium]